MRQACRSIHYELKFYYILGIRVFLRSAAILNGSRAVDFFESWNQIPFRTWSQVSAKFDRA